MPAKKAPASSAPKVMDVAHPRGVKANATTVPLIVTNRPILKDPMMNAEATPKPSAAEKPKEKAAPLIKKIELQPLADDDKNEVKVATSAPSLTEETRADEPLDLKLPVEEAAPEAPTSAPETETENEEHEAILAAAAEATADATVPAENAEEPKAESEAPSKPDQPEETPAESTPTEEPTAIPDADAEAAELLPGADAKSPTETATKEAREAAEKQLALDKLIADGTYILPVNQVEKRRMHRTLLVLVILLIVVVLAIAGFILALDAGYLHIDGLSPPTNLIK